jgi:TolB protein
MRKIIVAIAAVCAVAAIVPASAGATFPAKNGRIAFKRFLDPALSTSAIFTIDANGKRERQLTHPPAGITDNGPDWSPDGSRITFERCRVVGWCEVWTVRADGMGETRLGPDCLDVGPPPLCEYRGEPEYSPSATIAFGRAYVDSAGLHADLDEMNGAGAILRSIVASPAFAPASSIARAAWAYSPEGERLVVEVQNSDTGTPPDALALYVGNADASQSQCPDGTSGLLCRITPYELRAGDHPDWSPDGQRILFRSNGSSTDAVGSQLYTARPDGTHLEQITHLAPGTRVLSYSYSPDGRWITVGLSGVDGQPDVYVMRTNGHAIRPVTRTSEWDSAPDWGPRP